MAEESGLSGLEHSLGNEVGGVPVWVIGTGAGVAIALGYWVWKKQSGDSGSGTVEHVYDPQSADASADTTGDTPDSPYQNWLGDGDNLTNPAYPVGGNTIPSPITNGQWAKQAIDGLISKGDDPALVTSAISKYIAGQGLSAAEKSVVTRAITIYGTLPEGAKALIDLITSTTPGPVRNIHVKTNYVHSATIDWDPPTPNAGVSGYSFKLDGKALVSPLYSGPYNTGNNLKPGSAHTVSIAARNLTGATGPYTDFKFTTKKS